MSALFKLLDTVRKSSSPDKKKSLDLLPPSTCPTQKPTQRTYKLEDCNRDLLYSADKLYITTFSKLLLINSTFFGSGFEHKKKKLPLTPSMYIFFLSQPPESGCKISSAFTMRKIGTF